MDNLPNPSLNQITNQPLPTPSPQVMSPIQPLNQLQGTTNTPAQSVPEEKPRGIKVIGWLFVFVTVLYFLSAVSLFLVPIIMSHGLEEASEDTWTFTAYKWFPDLPLLGPLFSLVTVFFLYVSLKVFSGSRFSWWLGLLSVILVPVPVAILTQHLVASLIQFGLHTQTAETNQGASYNPTVVGLLSLANPTSFLLLLILISLIIYRKRFTFPNTSLSTKSAVTLLATGFLFVLPIFAVTTYGFYRAYSYDYGRRAAKASVSYHFYEPANNPDGRTIDVPYTKRTIAGNPDGYRSVYSSLLTDMKTNKNTPSIIFDQAGVEPNFDPRSFVNSLPSKPESVSSVNISKSKNGQGYLIQTGSVTFLVFVTPDNVFISLGTVKAPVDELVHFAESLQASTQPR